MNRERSENKVASKWKGYFTGLMTRNFISLRKIDKYFRMDITDSMSKAIEENWLRILGLDFEIISINMCKNNEPLGIALQGRNMFASDGQEMIQRHFLLAIMPMFCIGATNRIMVGDELLEINGLKVYGMRSKDVISALKKLPNYIQIVVARPNSNNNDCASDYGRSECIQSPISFYDMDEDLSSYTGTMKSNSSVFSGTSRDYGSTVSVGGLIDGRYDNVADYLRTIIGWRGPLVLEFRKRNKESLGLALEEIKDPKTKQLIIVFKIILSEMRASKDGRIHVGDRLLQVNGKSVNGVGFKKVCQWMKSAPGGRLVICICKPHFPAFDIESVDYLPDNNIYHTLTDTDKLPKLQEEVNDESTVIPPVPEKMEHNIVIDCSGDKLGIFLDIVDNGINGCRIKKIARGMAKNEATLQEGDHITIINGISLRIDEKNKLENCLRTIAQYNSDYKITYLRKEDIDCHKRMYSNRNEPIQEREPIKKLYPSEDLVVSKEETETPNNYISSETACPITTSFVTFYVTIINDDTTNLGLVLLPSLTDPSRFVAITDIYRDSLADKCQLLKINDELLSVNSKPLEFLSCSTVGRQLKELLLSDGVTVLKLRRLVIGDDNPLGLENKYEALLNLPDFYFCSILKSQFGFGFSVLDLLPGYGVMIDDIDPQGAAVKVKALKCGHRIVMINNCPVSTLTTNMVIKIIKNTHHAIDLIMEKPKFREFHVRIVKDSSNSFGLNVAGGIDTKSSFVIIESIVPNTDCQYSVELESDDIIIESNEISMLNRNHEEIIRILRSLPRESTFKIWRKLPFCKRDFLVDTNSQLALDNYLQHCQFSVTINKPVSTIPTFGISFNDVIIVPNDSDTNPLQRYKAVISIDRHSICEKYAPEVISHCYLVAINGLAFDTNVSCEEMKRRIDGENHIELTLSRDIPYTMIHTDDCSQETAKTLHSNITCDDHSTQQHNLSESLNLIVVADDHTDSNETPISNCLSLDQKCDNDEIVSTADGIKSDFGIKIVTIIVRKLLNVALGFHVFGGRKGGPGGETLPVCVVAVERNTCNWPRDRNQPWLTTGCQLLELNGSDLTSMDSLAIGRLLNDTEGDLTFKVVTFDR